MPATDATAGVAMSDDDGEDALWSRVRAHGDVVARESLLSRHLPYARVVAASYYARRTHNDIEFEEYAQLAAVGLIEAFERFDPVRGVLFRTFAARRMHGAILDGLERLTEKNQQIAVRQRLRRERLVAIAADAKSPAPSDSGVPVSRRSAPEELFRYLAEVGVGLALGILLEGTGMVDAEAFDHPGETGSPEIRYFQRNELEQLRRRVKLLVEQLPDQERSVIRHHYLQEISFAQIADSMSVTRGRVSQIHRRGLLLLQEALSRSKGFDRAW